MIKDNSRLLVAMDFAEKKAALSLAEQLDPKKCRLKIGKEMFTRFGPELIKQFHSQGFEIFLDLKFHDIPNTVAKACLAAADLGVWMVNLHASGGRNMMEKAAEVLDNFGKDAPHLIAVTMLTSMNDADMAETGIAMSLEQRVLLLASLTKDCGLDGVVCSALEANSLRNAVGDDFLLVTPGIRPVGADAGDQQRIMTPTKALAAGADYLVIGRPITQARDPLKSLCEITDSIDDWLASTS